jgi:hypothetical protein
MRRTLLRSLSALSLLALVAGGTSGAVASSSSTAPAAAADKCDGSKSALAEPASCLSKPGRPAPAAAGTDVAIPAGNAFADGLTTNGGSSLDKVTFPPGNMSTTQQVAAEASTISIFGYDFSPDTSVLYGVDQTTSSLLTINQATGASTTVGPMVMSPAGGTWLDVAIDPNTGAAYALSGLSGVSYTLYSVNLTTGAATVIATVPQVDTLIDMSINCAGQMYATSITNDALYSVNRTTGAVTLIGPLGVNISFAQGIDFDNATGILHAWLYLGGGAHQYSSLNLTTGAATTFPAGDPNGEFEAAIKTTCPAPTASVTTGPTGHTADLRPTFGFTTTNSTSVQCSVDKGTAAFVTCPGATYQPAANLAPGDYTFRVKANGAAGQAANATRAFTVVDCAALKAAVAKAKKAVKKAKKALAKAKQSGDAAKIKKAAKKAKKAKKKLKKAKAALKAEPVCS